MLFGISWAVWLSWVLAAFFVVNGVVNFINPPPMREAEARWGLPPWFHWLNGAMQVAAGLCLALPQTRMLGVALGVVICLGIFAVLIRNKDFGHLPPGAVLFVLLLLAAWGLSG